MASSSLLRVCALGKNYMVTLFCGPGNSVGHLKDMSHFFFFPQTNIVLMYLSAFESNPHISLKIYIEQKDRKKVKVFKENVWILNLSFPKIITKGFEYKCLINGCCILFFSKMSIIAPGRKCHIFPPRLRTTFPNEISCRRLSYKTGHAGFASVGLEPGPWASSVLPPGSLLCRKFFWLLRVQHETRFRGESHEIIRESIFSC